MKDDYDFATTSLISDVSSFLQHYQLLYQHPLKDFFKENVHSSLEETFPGLAKITVDELLKIIPDENKNCSELSEFLKQLPRMLMDPPCSVEPINKTILPKAIFKGITAKKEQEIRYFAHLIKEHAESNDVKTIVDIGCGKGHLLKILSKFDLKVIGFDANKELIESAKELNNNKSVIFVHHFITTESENLIKNYAIEHGPIGIISLHGCGDLQKTITKIYTKIDPSLAPFLLTVGCCYHKRNFQNNGWAFSKTIPKILQENDLIISRPALRLACDLDINRFTDDNKKLEKHQNALFFKAIAEKIDPDLPLRNEKIENTEDFIKVYEKNKRMVSVFNSKENLEQILDTYKPFKETIMKYSILQSFLQPILESLVINDAYFYLYESGVNAKISSVFPKEVSSKNKVVIAWKK